MSKESIKRNLEIKNFKSLKDVKIETSRINIFIGRPNSGKSNLLEAITLLDYIQDKTDSQQPAIIRYNSLDNLFYDRNLSNDISVKFDDNTALISYYPGANVFFQLINPSSKFLESKDEYYKKNWPVNELQAKVSMLADTLPEGFFASKAAVYTVDVKSIGQSQTPGRDIPIRRYVFQERLSYSDLFAGYLKPYGENLFTIVQNDPKLRQWLNSFYHEYGLEFLMDFSSKIFEIQKREKGVAYKIPFELTPDTLRRMLFHVAAVYSNREAIILFEEPESQSFPPYINELSEVIKTDENNNEFFITTHSPYFFNSMVEDSEKIKDISFFHVYYEEFQTKIKKLTQQDLNNLWGSGADVFFNIDSLRK